MSRPIVVVLSSLLSALTAAVVVYLLNRWQKHKEIYYTKKIEAYVSLSSALTDFSAACKKSQSIDDFSRALVSYSLVSEAIYKAQLFIPDEVYYEIIGYFTDCTDWDVVEK